MLTRITDWKILCIYILVYQIAEQLGLDPYNSLYVKPIIEDIIQASAYEKQSEEKFITKFRGYRCVKSCTPLTK